jgi:hypothetical protein
VFNIGNHQPVELMAYIEALEQALGKTAQKNFLPCRTATCRRRMPIPQSSTGLPALRRRRRWSKACALRRVVSELHACLTGAGLPAPLRCCFAGPTDDLRGGSLAPPLLLAERYRDGIDVPDYWISEKLDGVRAVWDGRALRFRSGNPVPAPQWFLDGLPAEALDGELWLGAAVLTNCRRSCAARRRSTRNGGACAT